MFGGNFGTTPSFGSFGSNLANKPATTSFSSPGTSLFGSNTTSGGFGTNTTNNAMFGQPQQQSGSIFGFGQNKTTFGTTSTFGATPNTSTMFGQQNRLATPSTGLFGSSTATVSPFSSTQGQAAGTSIPFNPITGNDTMMRNGVPSQISTRHQCITCMKEYENKSLEELRLEDYQVDRKGPSQGQSGLFGQTQQQQQQGGLFTNMGANQTTPSFGQPAASFGTPASTGGSIFGGLNQTKPAGGFFSNTTTSSAPFGGASSGFSFNTTATQSGSLFGTNTSTTSTTPGFGTTSAFGVQQPQQQQTLNPFGAKTQTTSAPTTGFGFGSATSANNNAPKPLTLFGNTTGGTTAFGSTATPNFGTGSGGLFGSQNQPTTKSFSFGSGFGTTQPATATSFGATPTSNFSFPAATSAPTVNFGSTAPSFGTTTSNFGSFGQGTNFSFSNPTSTTGFGNTSFSFNTPSSGFSLFSNTTGANANANNANAPVDGMPFATTPFKDSPLFYNLIANRNVEEMTKPTSPIAQRAVKEASRRRTSASFNTTTTSPVIKNLTFPVSKNRGLTKHSIFDGFEEDDHGTSIDILSPKTSVKKLSLKDLKLPVSSPRTKFILSPTKNGFGSSSVDQSNGDLESTRINNLGLSFEDTASPCVPKRTQGSDNGRSSHPVRNEHLSFSEDSFLGRNSVDFDHDVSGISHANGDSSHGCGIICTRPGYYIKPSLEEIDKMCSQDGHCYVSNFCVGRYNFGEIRFLDRVDVSGVNIDEIVLFRHKEVVVYPDDEAKPPVGEYLNCPAEITLERVWPIDKLTKDPIKSPEKVKAMNYADKLRRSCIRLDAEFLSYNEETGNWCFRVKHFSKYSCEVEENEDDPMDTAGKGLGGIPVDKLKQGAEKGAAGTAQPSTSKFPSTAARKLAMGDAVPDANILENMPVLHTLMASSNAPSARTLFTLPHDDDEYFMSTPYMPMRTEGDVEINPLTPSESEDGSVASYAPRPEMTSILSKSVRHEPVLGDSSATENFRSMKSVMFQGLLNQGEEDSRTVDMDAPPNKRFCQPRQSLLSKSTLVQESLRRDSTDQTVPLSMSFSNKTMNRSLNRIEEHVPHGKQSHPPISTFHPSLKKRSEVENLETKTAETKLELLRLHDIPPFSRRSCRVSFGPNGTFVVINNTPKTEQNGFNFKATSTLSSLHKVVGMPTASWCKNVLEGQLMVHIFDLEEEDGTPENKVMKHLTELEDALMREGANNEPRYREEMEMWSLCDILWPAEIEDEATLDDESFLLTQRVNMTEWLKTNAYFLFGDLYNANDKSLLGLLSRGEDLEAAQKAVLEDCYYIALMISQDVKHTNMYAITPSLITRYVRTLEEKNAIKFVDPKLLNVFLTFCETPEYGCLDLTEMTTSEWFQHFAIYYWYFCPCTMPLGEAVLTFLSLLKTQMGDMNEDVTIPSKCDSSIANLCIHLLRLYSCTGYPLEIMLNPKVNNTNTLDFKVSWMLMNNLMQYGYIADDELNERLTTSFAGQLESLGMFIWGVFILKHLPASGSRDVMIRRFLERNLKCKEDRRNEQFLVDNVGIPPEMIYSVKAMLAARSKRKDLQIRYLLNSNEDEEAYSIFVTDLLPLIISPMNNKPLLELLEEMKLKSHLMSDWNLHGEFAYQYLKLNVAGDNCDDPEVDKKEIEKNLTEFLKAFVRFKPRTSDESALMLEITIRAQKIAQLLLTEFGETIMPGKTHPSLSSFVNIVVPQEYMQCFDIFFSSWLP